MTNSTRLFAEEAVEMAVAWMRTAPTNLSEIPSDWLADRVCVAEDHALFFPVGHPEAAIAICATCPARIPCGAAAVIEEAVLQPDVGKCYGVRGGTSGTQRLAMLRAFNSRTRGVGADGLAA